MWVLDKGGALPIMWEAVGRSDMCLNESARYSDFIQRANIEFGYGGCEYYP